ncbi:MAG: PAS domain S-box protein [Bacteroidota bacterium]|nr:PAS domain S-box protein [Bacteroidota bacterium]
MNDLSKTKAELVEELEELRLELKESKDAKLRTEERFRELAELLPIVVFELDNDGKITYINQKGFEAFRYSEEDFRKGLHALELIAPEKRSYTQGNITRLLRGEKTLISEQLALRKDGTKFPAITHSAPIYQNGEISGIRGILRDTIKEKETEEALTRSEEKYRRFFEEDLSGISVSDLEGSIHECNNSFARLFKCKTIEEAKKANAFDYYSLKEDRTKLLNILKYTRRIFNYEVRMKDSQGKDFEAIMNAEGIFDNDNITGIRTYIYDNTERKKAENELRQREEIFHGLFEKSSAPMTIIDPGSLKFKYINQAACYFYGYPKEELLQMGLEDISMAPPEIFDNIRHATEEDSFHYTSQHKLSNYEVRDVEIYGNKIKINSSDLLYLIIHDITKRKKAEKELESYKNHLESLVKERTVKLEEVNDKLTHEIDRLNIAERKIKDQFSFQLTMMNNIPVPIYIQNTYGKFVQCNKCFLDLLGVNLTQIIGKTTSELLDLPTAEDFDRYNNEILESNTQKGYEMKFCVSRGEEEKQIINNKVAFKYSDGSVRQIIGIIIDITEQKKLEEEIKNALNKEIELHALKSRFISTASHEFRTPLTSIRLYTDLLAMYGRNVDRDKYMEHISKIQKSVGYMIDLINDVLTLSRVETGKTRFNPVEFDLHKFCYEIIDEQKPNITENHIVKYCYNSERRQFSLDEKILKQILSNLISNALKYTPNGGEIEFLVNFEKRPGNLSGENTSVVIFTIKDQGIGIPEEDQKNLFEYFHRGENASNIPGTGLGLSIVKKSVDMHGGSIDFTSKINEGTIFKVSIPIE